MILRGYSSSHCFLPRIRFKVKGYPRHCTFTTMHHTQCFEWCTKTLLYLNVLRISSRFLSFSILHYPSLLRLRKLNDEELVLIAYKSAPRGSGSYSLLFSTMWMDDVARTRTVGEFAFVRLCYLAREENLEEIVLRITRGEALCPILYGLHNEGSIAF